MKFGRRYRLTIEMEDGDAVIIEPPFSVRFNLVRSTMASLNTADFSIYNLAARTRNRIFQDRFDFSAYRKIIFEAGYDTLTTVFVGSLFEANSERIGADIVTNINSRDGGFDVVGTKTYRTIAAGSTNKEIVEQLAQDFPNLEVGAIGTFDQQYSRPVVLNGNTYELMKRYTEDKVFIDLEKVYALQDREVVPGDLQVLRGDTGLLETPKRDDAFLTVTTLFEPRIIMGQQVRLDSEAAPEFNGDFKVIGVHHQGIISEAQGGSAISKFQLLTGSQVFGRIEEVDQDD